VTCERCKDTWAYTEAPYRRPVEKGGVADLHNGNPSSFVHVKGEAVNTISGHWFVPACFGHEKAGKMSVFGTYTMLDEPGPDVTCPICKYAQKEEK